MPKLKPGSGQYLHIEFVRDVKRQPERRKRGGYSGLKPPVPDDRDQHAQEISQEIT
ncbi:hypothetical protein MC7420_7310 [Coleofasciculus chthonoplastes PCC 7420]|uniref:Uncharacterized protein n=1 Tax=Coleofasciculus chthonoplastes PCC 7420 TaxID=118168 RepID=B4VHP1_9CYAN|nr:hypothetical protein [Coleofasciculus chthonoplastes]EDX78657.1 hypothetical protein MC7420_7310 [Coleofasciculus chthonoplastes PCC 7420]